MSEDEERVYCPFCDMPVKHYHTTKTDKWYRCILCLIKFSVSKEKEAKS